MIRDWIVAEVTGSTLVTHDSFVARRGQRIGIMKNGRLTFEQSAAAGCRV